MHRSMRSIGEHKRLGQRLVAVLIQAALAVLTAALPNATAAEPGESDCLALAMYWEARGGGREAMVAVGWVVLNRMKNPEFPDRACAVVRQGGEEPPCQFSYWCDGKVDTPQNDEIWSIARDLAVQMLKKPPPDPTGGALYFHSVDIAIPWKVHRQRTARIGGHIFYR